LRQACTMTIGIPLEAPRRRLRAKVRLDSQLLKPGLPKAADGNCEQFLCTDIASSSTPGKPTFRIKERHPEYMIVQNVFDAEMLVRLFKFLARKRPRAAKMKNEGGNSDDERKARYDDRDSKVSWFHAIDECPWLHDRLAEVTTWADRQEWKLLNLNDDGTTRCEYEETQFAVYGENQHFKAWHQDAYEQGNDIEDARQVTTVAVLSSRSAYTGGHFQAKIKGSDANKKVIKSLPLDAGDCVVFPAKRLVHRVSTVKTGIRKTLVFWASDKSSCKYHRERLKAEGSES